MYYSTLILLIANLTWLVVGVSSTDLFSGNDGPFEDTSFSLLPEDELFDQSSDEFFSIVDYLENPSIDDGLWTNLASQSPCVVSEADELFLFTRDGNSCGTEGENSIDLPSEALQLFGNPVETLETLPQKKQSSDPPESPNPIKPSYPGILSDEEADKKAKNPGAFDWDLDAMGLELREDEQGCRDSEYPDAVCCNGPPFPLASFNQPGLENCDSCTSLQRSSSLKSLLLFRNS
jgi:hypothetical protein